MIKRFVLSILVLTLFAMPISAFQNQIVATIDGVQVTMGQVDEMADLQTLIMQMYQVNPEFTQLLFGTEAGQNLLNEYRKQVLDQYVIHILLDLEVKKRGITLTREREVEIFNRQIDMVLMSNGISEQELLFVLRQQGIDSLEAYMEMFIEQNREYMLFDELQRDVVKNVSVVETEARAYYDQNPRFFVREETVNARHILVSSKEKAEELLAQIKAGANFADVARTNSTCPSSAQGGDLGYFNRGDMVEEFENAAFALKEGEVSGVVETMFGFHIIKAEKVMPAGPISFEEAKLDIMEGLLGQKQQEEWEQFMKDLRSNAKVEINL